MRRLSFILPIVLIALQCALWLRGRTRTDAAARILPSGNVQIAAIHHAGLLIAITQIPARPPHHGGVEFASMRSDLADDILKEAHLPETTSALGIAFRHDNGGMIHYYIAAVGDRRILYLPPWIFSALAAAMLILPILRIRRPKPGHCPTCNYDLRATPDRCPECGTAIEAPARIAPR